MDDIKDRLDEIKNIVYKRQNIIDTYFHGGKLIKYYFLYYGYLVRE